MLIYNVITGLLLTFAFAEVCFKFRSKAMFYCLAILIIVFFGTRNEVGTDYNSYVNLYETIHGKTPYNNPFFLTTEFFYSIICLIAPKFWIVLFVYSLLAVTIKCSYIKSTIYPFLSLAIYFSFCGVFYDMGIIRQGLAIGLCFYSLRYIQRRRFIKFFGIILFGVIFIHRTTLLFLPAYFLYDVKIKRVVVYLSIILCFVIGQKLNTDSILNIIGFLPQYFEKFETTVENYNDLNKLMSFSEVRKIIFCILFYEFLYRNADKRICLWNNLYILGVCLSLLFVHFTTLGSRGSYYYCCYEMLLIPACVYKVKKVMGGLIPFLAVAAYCFMYINTIIYNTENNDSWMNLPYIPYKSIIFE